MAVLYGLQDLVPTKHLLVACRWFFNMGMTLAGLLIIISPVAHLRNRLKVATLHLDSLQSALGQASRCSGGGAPWLAAPRFAVSSALS